MNSKTKSCPHCNRDITPNNYKKHIKSCDGTIKKPKIRGIDYDPNIGYKMGIRTAWNKGKTKETCEIINQSSSKISSSCSGKSKKDRIFSDEYKTKMSNYAKQRGLGGITQSRWIDYNGKKLGSSYELKLAQSLDEHSIKWDICKRFNYIDPFGKARTYTPDFFLPDYNVYLDPKNDFLIESVNPALGFSDSLKIELVSTQNNVRIIILNKEQLDWTYIKSIL